MHSGGACLLVLVLVLVLLLLISGPPLPFAVSTLVPGPQAPTVVKGAGRKNGGQNEHTARRSRSDSPPL